MKRVQYGDGKALLDLGCGDGRDAEFFLAHGFTVTAVDLADEAIRSLQERFPKIKAVCTDLRDVHFPDAAFDVIYAHLSLHYFDDATTRTLFRTVHRMLRSGGYFFVKCKSIKDPLFMQGDKVGEDMYRHGDTNPMTRHFFSEGYMCDLLAEFSEKEIRSSTAKYDGKESAFVDGVARK